MRELGKVLINSSGRHHLGRGKYVECTNVRTCSVVKKVTGKDKIPFRGKHMIIVGEFILIAEISISNSAGSGHVFWFQVIYMG